MFRNNRKPYKRRKPGTSIFQNPRLGAVPHIRIANGEHLSRKIGELASIIGTERFYLTVGGLLYKKSAQVGLKPDGVVVHNDAERIQASRILEEQVQEIESHERHVFNPAISEFVGMMAQVDELNEVRAKIAEEMAIQNKSPEEKREVNQDVKKALDIVRETERKITAKKQKSINKIKAAVLEKAPELAAETLSMSDEEFIIFANMYMNSHNDSIANEIALQGVLFAQEEHEIASEAERKLDAMPVSGKAGLYISAIKDAVKEYGREYLDSPLDHTLDLAEGTAYFAADVFVPGGIDNIADCYHGEIPLSEAAVYQAAGAGADIFLGGVVKKAGAKVGRALSTASKGLTKRVVEKVTKNVQKEAATNPSQRARSVGDVGTYGELTRKAPAGGWGDNLQAHHIPPEALMRKYGVKKNEGLSIMMTKEQHEATRSFKNLGRKLINNPKVNLRSELAADLWDVRRIFKKDGIYTSEINRNLIKGVKEFKQKFPEILKKEVQK